MPLNGVVARRLGARAMAAGALGAALAFGPFVAVDALAQPGSGETRIAQANSANPIAISSPIGVRTAYGHMPGRPWFADRPDYFNPFDFQWGDGRSWANAYVGVIGTGDLSQIVFAGNFNTGDVYLLGLSYGREFGSLGNALRFEWEIGASVHFGAETFASGHAYVIARWIWFPWNRWLMTTFAVGTGPSYATKRSKYEAESGTAARYKNGMMFEFTFGLPQEPNWQMQARIQHRSSIFGVLANAGSPSDYFSLGLKYRF